MSEPELRQDDTALMARVASGDEDAFRMLVERHQEAVFRLAYRHLGSFADAQDATQDTFQRLFEAAKRYRPEAGFRTYLFTIAARICLKRKQRHDHSRTEPVAPSMLDCQKTALAGSGPEDILARKERQTAIRRALDDLPADQRLALILLRYEEASCEEIARILGRTRGAVHSLLYRARSHLAILLRDLDSREVDA